MSHFTKSEISKITSFAFEAGEIATKSFAKKNFEIFVKPDKSKVTSADIAVSKFINQKLQKEFPNIPIICEEGNLRDFDGEVFFLIDPIDGTSSFISGGNEFSVNIALIENKKPIFGLIYAPLFEDGKMVFMDEKNQTILLRNNKKIILEKAAKADKSKLRIITSKRTKDENINSYISQIEKNYAQNFSVEKLSSSVKFFRLVEDESDIYIHMRSSMEWDTAAGQALVENMGGKVKNLLLNEGAISIGSSLKYKKPNFENQPFISFL